MSTRQQRLTEQYVDANRTSAKIILADPEKHGGEGSGIVAWARLVLAKTAAQHEPAPEFELVAET